MRISSVKGTRFQLILQGILLLMVLSQTACVNTLFMQPNEHLIKGEPKFSGNHNIHKDKLINSIRTRPNKTFIIIPKGYLKIYRFAQLLESDSSRIKRILLSRASFRRYYETGLNIILNKIGEKPVLLDSVRIRADLNNLQRYYYSKGYFQAKVNYEVKYFSRRFRPGSQASIKFIITEGPEYRVDSLKYRVDQIELFAHLVRRANESHLRQGSLYNEEEFGGERSRIAELLRNAGYFKINLNSIRFTVDTLTVLKRPPSPYVLKTQKKNIRYLDILVDIPGKYDIYKIGDVYLQLLNSVSGEQFMDTLRNPIIRFRSDTLSNSFRKDNNLGIKKLSPSVRVNFAVQRSELNYLNYNFLQERILLRPGENFSLKNVQRTQLRLQNMNILRTNVLRFTPNDTAKTLAIWMDMSLLNRTTARFGVEAFSTEYRILSSTNLPGVGGNITYRNNNVFRNAEKLEISGKGNVSLYYPEQDNKSIRKFFYTFGGRISLIFPKFLLPYRPKGDVSFFNPNTSLTLSQDNEQRIEFTRRITDLSIQYQWYHIPFSQQQSSQLTPLAISYIRSDLSDAFNESILTLSPFLRELVQRDFKSRYTTSHIYAFIFSDYATTRARSSHYFKGFAELGGMVPYLIDRYFNSDGNYKDRLLNNVSYGQFFKLSIEAKRYTPLGKSGEVVFRAKTGFADPLNYTREVPFESRFYAGGTNSLRGWLSNTVGPGTFDPLSNTLITPGGEIMIEANAEIRRDLLSFLEGALFLDAGNVWFAKGSSFTDSRGKLSTETLVLALDGGVGFRFDFSFLILRLDIAQQLYAPELKDWVIKRFPQDLGNTRLQYNLGIGYPF